MKALKEKRIGLRSLWRMGLVVLSVFALAFAACGSTESGEPNVPGDNGDGGAGTATVVPRSFQVTSAPRDPAMQGSGLVLEGQRVSLNGIAARIDYSDGSHRIVSDASAFSVYPLVFLGPSQTYDLIYTEKGHSIRNQVTWTQFGNTGGYRYLIDIDVVDRMEKTTYYIDEVPDLKGLKIDGVYSRSGRVESLTPGWDTQNDFFNLALPFDVNVEGYKWAWVWNFDQSEGSWSSLDSPGLLLNVGTWGRMFSDKVSEIPGQEVRNNLYGKRIVIEKLLPVTAIDWDHRPEFASTIFYDNSSLIGTGSRGNEWAAWRNAMSDATVKVTYGRENPEVTKTYTMEELFYLNGYYNRGFNSDGSPWSDGGTWMTPLAFGLFNTKGTQMYNDNSTWGNNGNPVRFNRKDYQNAGGGWAEWAILAQPMMKLTFRDCETSLQEIPIYNVINGTLTVSVIDGASEVILDGFNAVFQPPESFDDFLRRITITATYTRKGQTETKTKNLSQGNITYQNSRPGTNVPGYTGTGDYWTAPTLISTNIWNFYNTTDWQNIARLANFLDPTGTLVTTASQANTAYPTGLTLANSETWASKQKPVGTVIQYRAYAGDPNNVKLARSNKEILVAPVRWATNPQ
jgi:hypothetical protein